MLKGVLKTDRGNLPYYHQPKAKRVILKNGPEGCQLVVPPGISAKNAWLLIEKKLPKELSFDAVAVGSLTFPLHFNNGWSIIGDPHKNPYMDFFVEMEIRGKAIDEITPLVERLAEEFGFTYGKLFFRFQKTMWGSCSSQNNLNLNACMILLPEEIQEYLILHELTHTIHKHHGPAFWEHLTDICPDAIAKDRVLRRTPTSWKRFVDRSGSEV